MLETEAWVLHQGERQRRGPPESAELVRESFPIPALADDEVLADPIYGCWEGNMTHALERIPVDVCRFRREPRIVLGNAGVVRVVTAGPAVTDIAPGELCMVFPNAEPDAAGYMVKALAYDARKTMGLLARQTRLPRRCLIPIPGGSRYSLRQWAAFSLRYVTAWSNWRLAYGCYRLQMTAADCPAPFVVAWGGGVSLGQLILAKHDGCTAAMIASTDHRLASLRDLGIIGIDRREFADLHHDPDRHQADGEYRRRYDEAEATFLARIAQAGGGQPVAVFIDHIGTPVYRATLAALGRPEASSDALDALLLDGVDALVLNAWTRRPPVRRFHELPVTSLAGDVQRNVLGNCWLIQRVLPGMLQRGFGRIVFVSSISTALGTARYSSYVLGKSAIEGLMRSLAVEYGAHNVLANTVRLGIFKTERTRKFWGDASYVTRMSAVIPSGALGEPHQVGSVLDPLLAEDQYVNGAIIDISGGLPMFCLDRVLP